MTLWVVRFVALGVFLLGCTHYYTKVKIRDEFAACVAQSIDDTNFTERGLSLSLPEHQKNVESAVDQCMDRQKYVLNKADICEPRRAGCYGAE